MAWVYIIRNNRYKYYIGITSRNVDDRLVEHRSGKSLSTRYSAEWMVVYQEYFSSMKSARVREKQIKSWKGGNAFKKFLLKPPRSSNGRTPGSGPGYLGSSPSLGGLKRNE